MSFQLVYGDHEYSLLLTFEPHIEDRLIGLLGKAGADGGTESGELALRIADSISALVEFNDLPPTEKQLKYAIGIAQTLKMQLPAEVIQYRDAMAQFLSAHADEYRRRKSFSRNERK